jgi:LPXTG-motif cell wall-anchored protein
MSINKQTKIVLGIAIIGIAYLLLRKKNKQTPNDTGVEKGECTGGRIPIQQNCINPPCTPLCVFPEF